MRPGVGAGYRDIANAIRFEIARQLLKEYRGALGQIAAAFAPARIRERCSSGAELGKSKRDAS
jgi:hypothetical protein